ncbi:esterase 1 [Dichomitus squalens LYAD-421 SS1]|uniref:Carboxylic ester hydrolase n=1 Tax=Dichomitus squalens (strain LYAD-421) TaxID=732165 RepID=R7T1A8_DICSQ|nr:esterase 1 [Dichomitus squalens LYAD-421 SS1]EJF60967.1 esterase 1 [Dichomitus squalens LYAD-421 SS1]
MVAQTLAGSLVLLEYLALCFAAPVVQLGSSSVIGRDNFVEGQPVQEFFGGIHYAAPPSGLRRFAPPVFKPTLDVDSFDASNYGIPCPQIGLPLNASEDCLTVNILRPAGTHALSGLPVYAWIFGGGFINGDPSLYNASAIVLRSVQRGTPIVYVSINYRLGPFGFPQGVEATARGALNLGLKDQLTALEWIHRNIQAFGGDPSKITVAGGSAGAISISNLFWNSELSRYVRGAILQSGPPNLLPLVPSTRRDKDWQTFVSATPECATAKPNQTFDCLREASADTLIQALATFSAGNAELFPFSPVLDGNDGLIPDLPSRLLAAGKFTRLPLIAGTNLDDATIFVPAAASTDQDAINFFISYADPSDAGPPPPALTSAIDTLLELYPNDPALGSPFGTGNETFGLGSEYKRVAAIADDVAFTSTRRALAQNASDHRSRVFAYLFSDPQAVTNPSQGVAHGNEIDYTYGVPFLAGEPQPAAALSEAMLDYWISFVVTGDPNDGKGTARPRWGQYASSRPAVLQLQGDNVTMISDTYRETQIAFINSAPTTFNH